MKKIALLVSLLLTFFLTASFAQSNGGVRTSPHGVFVGCRANTSDCRMSCPTRHFRLIEDSDRCDPANAALRYACYCVIVGGQK